MTGAVVAGGRAHAVHDGRVRLTRRGRLVVVLAVLALLVVGFSATGHVASQAASSAGVQHARTVTVAPGESLWALAERIAPHADPRLVVDRIIQINHLAGARILAGQQLVVPDVR
jgi:LysM repeat protein